jgi:aminopeptidase
MSYTPDQKILENYAKVMVHFGLGKGKGMKKGDVVRLMGGETSKPLYVELCKEIWRSGGHIIEAYDLDDPKYRLSRSFFELASEEQLTFFMDKYYRGLIDQIDHQLMIIADSDPQELEGIDPGKMMRRDEARKAIMEWRDKKENAGKFSWSLALYGTPGMAAEAGLSEEEYWAEIVKACYLDDEDPVARWQQTDGMINEYREKLSALKIDKLHVEGEDVDLWISLGESRQWIGGGGVNIPSFEIFTTPDWRGTNGWIRFNQPLYRYGNLVEGIRLEFKDGLVVNSSATKNEKVLKEMIATKNADKVGEFSLTDRRFSQITKFMAETLYDENIGGAFGNTHIALGAAYRDYYSGDVGAVKKEEWERLGFNDSSVHTDMISTTDRTVTATMTDGSTQIIYKDGQFTL